MQASHIFKKKKLDLYVLYEGVTELLKTTNHGDDDYTYFSCWQ
jgi:hypothetical protein